MRNKKRIRLFPDRHFRNRRVKARQNRFELHQLDVKLNSRRGQRVRQCRRQAAVIKVVAIVLTLITASAAVRWAYRQAFYENSEFRLDRLLVETDGVLSEADVALAADVEMGMNLMTIDLKSVRSQLSALPMVHKVEVSRELPDLLQITIQERQPLAWLSCPTQGVVPRSEIQGYLVDQNGEVFRCEKLLQRYLDLPVIETQEMPKPTDGSQVESKPVKAAIRLIRESDRLFGADGLRVTEVRVRNVYSLQCNYNNLMQVIFSLKDIDRGLQDLRWIVTHAHSAGQQLATVNVIPSKNIPVTFSTPPAIQATPVEGLPETLSPMDRQVRSILNGG
ncbi:MAG: FtsQ-type POTRA domain-containing protein [Verrucomicrobiales bacterium]|nr:FtsQ-type POTRA domain-containing protein [Verrucomicrobiales bacterium]